MSIISSIRCFFIFIYVSIPCHFNALQKRSELHKLKMIVGNKTTKLDLFMIVESWIRGLCIWCTCCIRPSCSSILSCLYLAKSSMHSWCISSNVLLYDVLLLTTALQLPLLLLLLLLLPLVGSVVNKLIELETTACNKVVTSFSNFPALLRRQSFSDTHWFFCWFSFVVLPWCYERNLV